MPRAEAGGETGGKQIAAGRRFPIQHFPGDKNAGQSGEHQVSIKAVEANAAGGADRFGNGPGCVDGDRQGLDGCRQRGRIGKLFFTEYLMQQGRLDAGNADPALQMAG